jgi:hypothetical protein
MRGKQKHLLSLRTGVALRQLMESLAACLSPVAYRNILLDELAEPHFCACRSQVNVGVAWICAVSTLTLVPSDIYHAMQVLSYQSNLRGLGVVVQEASLLWDLRSLNVLACCMPALQKLCFMAVIHYLTGAGDSKLP